MKKSFQFKCQVKNTTSSENTTSRFKNIDNYDFYVRSQEEKYVGCEAIVVDGGLDFSNEPVCDKRSNRTW